MDKARLLIVDDDEDIRMQLKWALKQDYEILPAEDRATALDLLRTRGPQVVTLDLGLPPFPHDSTEGFAALEEILQVEPNAKVIVITGQDQKDNARKAIGLGAYDFLCKPIQVEDLKIILKRAFYVQQLEAENREIQREREREREGDGFEGLLGTSPQMQEVFKTIRKIGASEVPVLIVGESGTGKELAARALHRLSARRDGPFVAINCGAIPENLLESELFGHEKGAFTGAHARKKGRIEGAQGGTLFLDEVGELPLPLQVKLLRYLQEQAIERVGGRESIPVDARVLAATNADVQEALRAGTFREDLYYRLSVVTLPMPPLREREGDAALLARIFLQKYAGENGKRIKGFTKQAATMIETYSWPGNVRELENRVKRAVIMAEGAQVTPRDLELTSLQEKYLGIGLRKAREELERELITQAMAKNRNNLTKAAAELGISRPALYELMDKLGIKRQ